MDGFSGCQSDMDLICWLRARVGDIHRLRHRVKDEGVDQWKDQSMISRIQPRAPGLSRATPELPVTSPNGRAGDKGRQNLKGSREG